VQLNAAVFYVRWKDLQVTTANLLPPLTGTTARPNYIANAAGAKSTGVEVEGLAVLSDHWRINFAASYADPKYDDGTRDAGLGALCNSPQPVCTAVIVPRPPAAPAVFADIGGNQLARSTKSKGALGVEYLNNFGTAWDWSARADVSYQSKIYAESLNVAYFPSRTLLDASVSVASQDKRWSAQLWARNLTDEVYAANSFVIGFSNFYNPTIGDGRTFGITARFNY
jgi:iron complex outermembrane receptor protein